MNIPIIYDLSRIYLKIHIKFNAFDVLNNLFIENTDGASEQNKNIIVHLFI